MLAYFDSRGCFLNSGVPALQWQDDSDRKCLYTSINFECSECRCCSDLGGRNVFGIHEMCDKMQCALYGHHKHLCAWHTQTSTFAFPCLVKAKRLLVKKYDPGQHQTMKYRICVFVACANTLLLNVYTCFCIVAKAHTFHTLHFDTHYNKIYDSTAKLRSEQCACG